MPHHIKYEDIQDLPKDEKKVEQKKRWYKERISNKDALQAMQERNAANKRAQRQQEKEARMNGNDGAPPQKRAHVSSPPPSPSPVAGPSSTAEYPSPSPVAGPSSTAQYFPPSPISGPSSTAEYFPRLLLQVLLHH